MTSSTIAVLVLLGVLVVLGLVVAALYNGLVGKRNSARQAWSQIDVQLKRRYDLIPNLVETVKGYAGHERETLEKVMQARSAALATGGAGPAAVAAAENVLTGALRQLLAVVEAYPNLKANENFMALQEELTGAENRISFARQHYNDSVNVYNTAIEVIPANLVAGLFTFARMDFFALEEAAQRAAPQVKF